jgi:hypothetical protein
MLFQTLKKKDMFPTPFSVITVVVVVIYCPTTLQTCFAKSTSGITPQKEKKARVRSCVLEKLGAVLNNLQGKVVFPRCPAESKIRIWAFSWVIL